MNGLAVVTVGSFAAEQKFMTCGMVGSLERNIHSSQAIQPLTHISGAADQIYLLAGTLQHNKTPPWLTDYGEEFNALGGGGIGTGHLTLTVI